MLSILYQLRFLMGVLTLMSFFCFSDLRGCWTDDSESETEAQQQDAGVDYQNCTTNVRLNYFLLVFMPFWCLMKLEYWNDIMIWWIMLTSTGFLVICLLSMVFSFFLFLYYILSLSLSLTNKHKCLWAFLLHRAKYWHDKIFPFHILLAPKHCELNNCFLKVYLFSQLCFL